MFCRDQVPRKCHTVQDTSSMQPASMNGSKGLKRLNPLMIAVLLVFFSAAQVSTVFAAVGKDTPRPADASPPAIQLTGTASSGGEHWQFEILMNRSGSYLRKEWSGREPGVGNGDQTGFSRLVLITGSFRGEYRRIWSPIDIVNSTGYGRSHGLNDHEVALRLYHNGRIVGYTPGGTTAEWMDGKISEQFRHPLRCGIILLPSVIVWSDHIQPRGEKTTTYLVEHTKILSSARHSVFRSLLWQHFPKAAATRPKSRPSSIHVQNSALPGLRGNGITSRMFFMPVR